MKLGCSLSFLVWTAAFLVDGWFGIGIVAAVSLGGFGLLVILSARRDAHDHEVAWRRWAEWDVEDQRPWRGPR
jgi:hypothetical protein